MRVTDHRMLSGILLVCLNALTGIALSAAAAQTTAPNEWTWIGGSNTVTYNYGQPGVYGTLGAAAAGNIPGARDSAATWTDSSGNFWLFGGEGVDANGNFGELNDLWEFQPSTQEWTWMGGSSTVPASCAGSNTVPCGQPGVYGSLGSAAAANIPGGRYLTSYGSDSNGNFWLFGGAGFDANQNGGDLNDLWEFNPTTKEWTWMGGSSTVPASCAGSATASCGQPGIYGTLGSAAAANIPGSRDSATSWSDESGQLWIYGGEGLDSQGDFGQLDDLWRFDPDTEQWTWMGGSSTLPAKCANNSLNNLCGWPAVYGALGVFAPGISPGSRVAALGWRDKEGNFWLFGGIGSVFWESDDFSEIDQYDLWEFNPSTNQWAWMSGNSTSICGESSSENWCGESGIYGTQGAPAIANIPPSRSNATTWTDAKGNLWLFGGVQSLTTNIDGSTGPCNDMWVFESAANEWAWMNGDSSDSIFTCENTSGTYGVKGKPAAANTPSGRTGTASWTDSSGNLWAFGGLGWANGGAALVDLNDLWIYEPSAPTPQPSFELIASPNPINIGATGPGTPTITTGTTTVTILVAGGFDSAVTLTATPDTCNGVTCITGSFSPGTITGAGSSTLTISVTGTAIGIDEPIPLTITGSSGGISQSIQVIVDVTGAGQIAAPSFSVPGGTYSTAQTVSMSDAEGIAFIYYTTDGTTPTASSAVYVNPITVASTTTLKAFAMDVFDDQSAISSATYSIVPVADTPVFVPGGGTYSSAQSVNLSDSTAGATIYYTSDGSTPTTNSTVYSGPITVSSTETLKAIASASGDSLSAVASATYTINLPTVGFSITGTAVSVVPGATTGNISTISLTPSGGFTGVISLSCAITPAAASDPAACSIPASVTISGSTAQTTTLTVNTTAPTSALNRSRRFFGPLAGGTTLACILLVGIPVRRRRWWSILGMLVLFSVLGGALGCGGSGNGGGGGGGGNAGTTPGTYIITVTGSLSQCSSVLREIASMVCCVMDSPTEETTSTKLSGPIRSCHWVVGVMAREELAGSFERRACSRMRGLTSVGEWLSLVEHLVRDQGVGGSNPLSPTNLSLALSVV
jgi:N-acetylneuraminic acid mutarotase